MLQPRPETLAPLLLPRREKETTAATKRAMARSCRNEMKCWNSAAGAGHPPDDSQRSKACYVAVCVSLPGSSRLIVFDKETNGRASGRNLHSMRDRMLGRQGEAIASALHVSSSPASPGYVVLKQGATSVAQGHAKPPRWRPSTRGSSRSPDGERASASRAESRSILKVSRLFFIRDIAPIKVEPGSTPSLGSNETSRKSTS